MNKYIRELIAATTLLAFVWFAGFMSDFAAAYTYAMLAVTAHSSWIVLVAVGVIQVLIMVVAAQVIFRILSSEKPSKESTLLAALILWLALPKVFGLPRLLSGVLPGGVMMDNSPVALVAIGVSHFIVSYLLVLVVSRALIKLGRGGRRAGIEA